MANGLALLGSTGSIGTQTLEVVRAHPELFSVEVLTSNSRAELLIEQAKAFRPRHVVIADPSKYQQVKAALAGEPIEVHTGAQALCEVVTAQDIQTVIVSLVGFAGLPPTLAAIEAGKDIALANKEVLVVAGELVTQKVKEKGVRLLPIDSEHSAILQCLAGEEGNAIEKLILTASGGPFRGKTRNELQAVTKAQALKHPNWEMGGKITIDSATLMNKGLEVIEARWLFDVPAERIEVVVHPQSIIHSMVEFADGAVKAQLGLPDMRLPIQYALTYPERPALPFERFSIFDYPQLTFERPDTETFPNLALAFEALKMGGNAPCVLNAANEVAVDWFLREKMGFLPLSDLVRATLERTPPTRCSTLDDYLTADRAARALATQIATEWAL